MVVLAIVFIILQKTQLPYVPIQFVRIVILLSSIIPISLRVNIDFAKFYYALQINKDSQISGTVVRNTNCPE
jgi:phospholipid-translocating ATPase